MNLNKSVNLLEIQTSIGSIYLQGKPYHPAVETLQLHREKGQWVDAHLKCTSLTPDIEVQSVQIFSPVEGELVAWSAGADVLPCFYEQQNYEFVYERAEGTSLPVTFYHDNQYLREAVTPKGKRLLSGMLNFRNEVGFTELELRSNGQRLLSIELEIFPSKLDYKQDYVALLREVNEQVYNLSFDFLKRTYQSVSLRDSEHQSLSEFFSIISHLFGQMEKAMERISIQPHHQMNREQELRNAALVKRASRRNNTYLARHPQHLEKLQRPSLERENGQGIGSRPQDEHLQADPSRRGVLSINGEDYRPLRLLDTVKHLSYDTAENRMLRWMLERILSRLHRLRDQYAQLNRPQNYRSRTYDEQFVRRVDGMISRMERMLSANWLQQLSPMRSMSLSLVMQMAPGYREMYRYYLTLLKGLSIQSDLLRLSMKEISELYEYWCFLKLNELLSRKYQLVRQNVIRLNHSGLFVTLDRGQRSRMEYVNPRSGETFVLYYNSAPDRQGTPTLPQRPDNVLSLRKVDAGQEKEYSFIFDAKYKLNVAEEGSAYRASYGQPGPQEEDINTMHRYRDAIVHGVNEQNSPAIDPVIATEQGAAEQEPKTSFSNKDKSEHDSEATISDLGENTISPRIRYERSMYGAYVLFPYGNEEEYRQHHFYKSVRRINVGALPFLPNATTLVEEFLDELIQDSPEKAYERSTTPRGTEEYYANKLVTRNMIVGSVRGPEQVELALTHGFYHVPLKNFTNSQVITQLEYVAMYQSKRKFGALGQAGIHYYGRITGWQIMQRRDITEIPSDERRDDQLYVKFTVERWQERNEPITLGGQGIYTLLYTSKYIFDRAHELAELRLESDEDLRQWREKRRQGQVKVVLDNEYVDLAQRVIDVSVEEQK